MKNIIYLVLESPDHEQGGVAAIIAAYREKEKAELHASQYHMFYVEEMEVI